MNTSDEINVGIDTGKAQKVAMVACMRKLITILNTIVKNGEHWNPELA